MFKLPPAGTDERVQWWAFMVWVGLIGATLILLIDYQLKRQLLQAALEGREVVNALEREKRGFGHSASPDRGDAGSFGPVPGPSVEVGTMAQAATANGRTGQGHTRGTDPGSGTDSQRFHGLSEPMEP